jgi:UDP-N-acetylglucosamine diphosphorylase/glucosamine-1-phosphate N-acetyltransferase
MKICIFEDSFISGLFPVNSLRHTSQIICGTKSLLDKIESILGPSHKITLHSRKHFSAFCREIYRHNPINVFSDEDFLMLNSRVIFTKTFLDGLLLTIDEMKDTLILHKKDIIAFHISKNNISKIQKIANSGDGLFSLKSLSNIEFKQVQLSQLNNDETEELKIINSPADLINFHAEEIKNDIGILLQNKKFDNKKKIHCELINPSQIIIERDCKINRNVVIDASKGGVYISKNSTIEPFSFIEGPVFVGENTVIRSGSKLYGPIYIGNRCKISGEIACSIFHSNVNKQHLGFIGHSYICEWVNLGAGTTTSNLKNNYSKISLVQGNRKFSSGSIFIGSIIGDHTKTGISTMLNTGTIIGISSNLFGCGYHPKFIDSFSWADASKNTVKYEFGKALQTAKISMSRRDVRMTNTYENLMAYYYKDSKHE